MSVKKGSLVDKFTDAKHQKILEGLRKQPPNDICADCEDTENNVPFVCTNYNIFICNVCASIHREFGDRVKSVTLSNFTPAEIQSLQDGGNKVSNQKWLAKWKRTDIPKPLPTDTKRLREFLQAKYIDKRWFGRPEDRPKLSEYPSDQQHESKVITQSYARENPVESYVREVPVIYQGEKKKEDIPQQAAPLRPQSIAPQNSTVNAPQQQTYFQQPTNTQYQQQMYTHPQQVYAQQQSQVIPFTQVPANDYNTQYAQYYAQQQMQQLQQQTYLQQLKVQQSQLQEQVKIQDMQMQELKKQLQEQEQKHAQQKEELKAKQQLQQQQQLHQHQQMHQQQLQQQQQQQQLLLQQQWNPFNAQTQISNQYYSQQSQPGYYSQRPQLQIHSQPGYSSQPLQPQSPLQPQIHSQPAYTPQTPSSLSLDSRALTPYNPQGATQLQQLPKQTPFDSPSLSAQAYPRPYALETVCSACSSDVTRVGMTAHQTVCPQRTVQCAFCKQPVKYAQMNEHLELCSAKPHVCHLCGQSLAGHELVDHFRKAHAGI